MTAIAYKDGVMAADTAVWCHFASDVGDDSASLYSVSQGLAAAYVTSTDPTLDTLVNLNTPLTVTLRTAIPANATLVIYGGALEGM